MVVCPLVHGPDKHLLKRRERKPEKEKRRKIKNDRNEELGHPAAVVGSLVQGIENLSSVWALGRGGHFTASRNGVE
jgi:hypothetical protein